jgi:hypothetical protein
MPSDKYWFDWYRCHLRIVARRGWPLQSEGGWCEEYRYRLAVVVHHLNYACLFNQGPEDLMALCVDCHNKMHPLPKAHQLQLPLPLP